MWDRYDPRGDDRDRGNASDRSLGGRGGTSDRDRNEDRDPRDVFTKDLDLPRGRERGPVRDRNHVYEINGDESRMLATVGAFRVVSETDLRDPRNDAEVGRRSLRHLENEGLIRTVPSGADERVAVLTDRGRDLLEANRSVQRDDRTQDPRQAFYAGLRKPRELSHDSKVYRAYQRAEARLRERGGEVRRAVLDYELKREYQRFLHERNCGRRDCDGRPDREPAEIESWAQERGLPCDEGHVRFPDVRVEYEDIDGLCRYEDLEVVTENCRGAHASGAAQSGFTCYRAGRGLVGGRDGSKRISHPRLAEELIMTFPPEPTHWSIEVANAQRAEAIAAFGFTDRQARFLVQVLLHAGAFVERQYCSFAGIVHGQNSTNFINALIERRFASPIATGKRHRGRMFHVHYKPLWAAIGEPDSRFRKPAPLGRMIERVMLLDAVLDDEEYTWLGPSMDKRRHFMRHLGDQLPLAEYPRSLFGDAPPKAVRYFPDKLPIGVQPFAHPHVLLYLVTRLSPMDFRLFLLRHARLLQALNRWTLRLLIPRPLAHGEVSLPVRRT